MSEALEIIDKRHSAIERVEPSSPLLAVMDKLASNPNLDADKIERLFNLFLEGQRKMAEMADERAFAEAMADFKKNPPQIVKSRLAEMMKEGRKLYEYNFADLDAYTSAAMAPLAERGITWSFPFVEKDGQIFVSCILRYGLYKHTPTTLSSPPDQTGGKNAIQAKASTLSYLERYTFCGATGLTAAMPDNDGAQTVEADEQMDESVAADFIASIEGSGTIDELVGNFRAAMLACGVPKSVLDQKGDVIGSAKCKAEARAFTDARTKMIRKLKGAK
jgi:hypothetical protein